MDVDRFGKEEVAFEAFARLMKDGKECRVLFESARMPLPPPLARFLGEDATPHSATVESRIVVPKPDAPPRPSAWQEDWIWVPAREVMPQTLVRAILRMSQRPMGPKQIANAVEDYKDGVVPGTIANIGTRLERAGLIAREDGIWRLANASLAPVIHDGYAWGTVGMFDDQDVAIHRRILIVHVLRAHSDGLQIIQLTRAMETCEWVRTPLSKDLIKTDLHLLADQGKVKKVTGATGKWKAVEQEASMST